MIQFNLLPDIKRDYERARRNKRLTFLVAGIAAVVSILIMGIMFFTVQVLQKGYSNDLSADIKNQSGQLTGTSDINKILTIQNQLSSLPALHQQKPVATRLISYIKKLTPSKATIATLNTDFTTQAITITGSADSIPTINQFVDTLKFTTYQTKNDDPSQVKTGNAFSQVVLVNFGKDDKGASYQISFKYDPAIFAGTTDVDLVIPVGKITTRSETEKPESIFQPLSNTQEDNAAGGQ